MFTHNRLPSPSILKKLYTIGYDKIQRENPEMLTVYNGGSFLNDEEIPLEIQQWICEQVNMDKTIKTLFVESRAEFVNIKRLNALTSILNGKKLVLGIGLECVTDSVREKCINKGLPIEVYEQAVKIAKSCNVDVLTYVFLKPLFLNENEAIEECVRTIEYAFKTGAGAVALEAAFIQPDTRMEKYYRNGEFRPPWLWSIIEVIRRTHHLGFVYVGKFDDEPAPIATPHNCSRCSFQINKLLQDYRETFNLSLFEEIDCECKSDWLKELNKNLVNN
jgi:hypothetical protein